MVVNAHGVHPMRGEMEEEWACLWCGSFTHSLLYLGHFYLLFHTNHLPVKINRISLLGMCRNKEKSHRLVKKKKQPNCFPLIVNKRCHLYDG